MELFNKTLIRETSLIIIVVGLMVVISQLIGFGKAGFTDQSILIQFLFYIGLGSAYVIALVVILIRENYIRKGDERYGDSLCINSQGQPPSLSFFKKYSTFQILWVSIIIALAFSLFNLLTKQLIFTGVSVLPQQFSQVDSLFYSSALIPASENFGAFLVLGLSLFYIRNFARARNWSKSQFQIVSIILISLLISVYGLINHITRYAGSDLSLETVFFFWLIGGILSITVGSFLPFWILHIVNNLFFDLKRLYSIDTILTWTLIILIILIMSYLFVYLIKKNKQKLDTLETNLTGA